jgi:MFS family permease
LLVLYAITAGSAPLFFVGSVVLGSGWGPSYMAGFRAIAALAPPQHKAEILATLFFVNYLFFSVPAIIAGLVASHFGLHTAALAFGVVMTCMGAIAGFGIYAADHASAAQTPEPCPAPCTVPHLVECGGG